MAMEIYEASGPLSELHSLSFVNMDEAAVVFDLKPNSMIYQTMVNIVSIRSCGRSNRRMKVCVAIASNGYKLPLFVISKGETNGILENNLPKILPLGLHGCRQTNGWMDDRSLRLWTERILDTIHARQRQICNVTGQFCVQTTCVY